MLRLRTLGGLTIEDENGPLAGAIARKRSLGLLALVGLGTEQGVSRDRVLAFLWPESDADRARNSLKQTLFQLRQDLHQDVFARAPGVLRLDPEAISVDACDFQAAVDRANPTTAVTIYRGPFLDGFYLPGLSEFERWVESERVRLAQRYADSLEALASTAASLGDQAGAVAWWRKLAAHDPVSARYATGLMRALAQSGDKAAALEHARVYEELVRAELESEPDPEVTELARQLRSKFARWTTPKTTPTGPAVLPRRSPPPSAAPSRPPPAPAPAAAHPPQRPRLRLPVLIGLFLVMLLVDWWFLRQRDRPSVPAVSPDLVAVFPFSFSGAAESAYLASGMVDLLSASFDGAGSLRSVPPSLYLSQMMTRLGTPALDAEGGRRLARQLGAGLFVMGDIVATGNRVSIGGAMYDASHSEPVARSTAAGDTKEFFSLADRLAADLIASRLGTPRERLSRVAATTTRSLPAFKAYLDGEQSYVAGREAQAIEAFQRAISADTGFALAYYRLSDAADRAGRPDLAQASAERALRFGSRLGERERRLIQAQHAWRMGNADSAEQLCRSLVTDYVEDVEAWLLLGEVLVHGNPLRGRSSTEARGALEQVLARDPGNGEALIHLARIAYLQGKTKEVDALLRRLLATGQGAEVAETRAFRAFALGDRPGQKRVTQLIRADPARVPTITALDAAVKADDLEGSERFGQWLTGPSQPPDLQSFGHRLLAQARLTRGQWREARREVDLAARFDPVPALELWSLFASLAFVQLPRGEIEAARDAVRRWDARAEPATPYEHTTSHTGLHPYLRLHRLGLLDARLGDTTAALRSARLLDRVGTASLAGRYAHTLAESIRAHVAAIGGRDDEALGRIEGAGWEAAASVFVSEAYDRLFRAELLEKLGREDEALGWYGSIAERAAYELVYLAPAHRHQAEIYARRGQRELAAEHYRKFIELWKNADAELQPEVQKAREELGTLEKSVNSKR